jgi:hypothetical protein
VWVHLFAQFNVAKNQDSVVCVQYTSIPFLLVKNDHKCFVNKHCKQAHDFQNIEFSD